MRIRVIVPITSFSEDYLEDRRKRLSKEALPMTELEFVSVKKGPITIESFYEEELAAIDLLENVKKAEEDGVDAVIIWCSGDPAVHAARELVKIPVVGPGEASFILAALLAHKFTVISPLERDIVRYENMAKILGIESKLASVRPLGITVLGLRSNREKVVERIILLSEKAIKEDGAHAIVLGCLGMFGMAKEVQEKIGIPVIDPGIAALKIAELLVQTGLSFSKLTYPYPPKKES
jgi:allantoin racemase